jgi:peptidoglycan/xylan/chitin deacetylase (PgdA/CDA1 family)
VVRAALAFVLLVVALGAAAQEPAAAPQPGDRIEAFTLAAKDGGSFEWKPGKVTVLSFCAFWCDTWKEQLPRVGKARSALSGLPVSFLTISVDGRWSERGTKAAVGHMLSDRGGQWTSAIRVDRVPYTLVLDKSGRVVWATFGTVRSDALVQAVRNCLDGSSTPGPVYLTFDDFPSKDGSEELLDVLRAEHAPATFFCLVSKAERRASVMRRAVREGHQLEIHSWDHDAEKPELAKCRTTLERICGVQPGLYRPPGSEKILTLDGKSLGMKVVDPYDFSRPGVDELVRRVGLQVRAGSVIQLHAGVSDTITALPRILQNLRDRGFQPLLLRERQ